MNDGCSPCGCLLLGIHHRSSLETPGGVKEKYSFWCPFICSQSSLDGKIQEFQELYLFCGPNHPTCCLQQSGWLINWAKKKCSLHEQNLAASWRLTAPMYSKNNTNLVLRTYHLVCFACISSFKTPIILKGDTNTESTLKQNKLMIQQVKWHAQGHTASKCRMY